MPKWVLKVSNESQISNGDAAQISELYDRNEKMLQTSIEPTLHRLHY